MITFPKDFLLGAATSSYQVEGGNNNCDWWVWEKQTQKETSQAACRHYDLFREDFDLARCLNHNCHRLSIEWSRVEPNEGEFNQKEIDHYKEVIQALNERGLKPVVTLHHFTHPVWFSKMGSWTNKRSPFYFNRFAQKIVKELCTGVNFWITINEPVVYIYHAYLFGLWPPQEKSAVKSKLVAKNMALAHIETYRSIHNIYKQSGLTAPMVSIAQNVQAFVACTPTLRNKLAVYLRNKIYNFSFLDKILRSRSLDYIGINYYNRGLVETRGWSLKNLLFDNCTSNHHPLEKNSLGWDIYPQGLRDLLIKLKTYNLPVFITENGICTSDDIQRWRYIRDHLANVKAAMDKGVKIIGYIYWSLLDNFEWDKGFGPRFGIVEVDYSTYKRIPRQSALQYAQVCKTKTLD